MMMEECDRFASMENTGEPSSLSKDQPAEGTCTMVDDSTIHISTEEIDRPFLDVAQFFLEEDELKNDKFLSNEEETKADVNDGTRGFFKTFTPVQLHDASSMLIDSSRTFVPIADCEDDGSSCFDSPFLSGDDEEQGEDPLLFLHQEGEDNLPGFHNDNILSLLPGGGFQGDDLLLTGEGDLFMEEVNFFNFTSGGELEERERETPSPATVDTEKEDEGEEGEDNIKMEDKISRTISPLALHSPASSSADASKSVEEKKKLEELASAKKKEDASQAKSVGKDSPRSRKRSLAGVSGTKADQKRTKRKRKTPEQLAVLEREFDANPMPNKEVRDQLSSRLGLTSRQVQIWFQNKRAKVKNSNSASAPTTPFQTPSASRSSSPLVMLAPQGTQQQGAGMVGGVPKGQTLSPRLLPQNFSPEAFGAHPLPLPPHAFFDMLSARGVNHLLASLAALSPHQQQALADLPALISANAHIVPTPIAPAPAPTHVQLPTPIAPSPTTPSAAIHVPSSTLATEIHQNPPVSTAV